ncbi:MAG: tRNA-2-methylthio-N(6)-dimethylallyladenosine synthase [Candidatus Kapaibacterium sp.]|nr:MAG: tRNA-2-methylthio-N(6)-dimethylallyladenosine synthase [Candidatus Kapabacteria bacterium]
MHTLELPVLTEQQQLLSSADGAGRALYVETYGCQMNLNDTEIVQAIMAGQGYRLTTSIEDADVVLLNTCAIRDNAERKIHERLKHLRYWRKRKPQMVVGVLGCMAERLRSSLLGEQGLVDIVVGPDEYRRLPELVERAFEGELGIAVKLSRVETYDDITPIRTQGISAWISIMRGCDKFCTFCVVPFTRGRERSRPLASIVREAENLWEQGFREVTLLGQNVNSYRDPGGAGDFADLLAAVATAVPHMRIRYTTSHPYDMSDRLIETMAAYANICPYIHLPVQSGSNRILQLMNRHYTVEQYLGRIEKIRATIPGCALSTDIIVGFCTETDEDHQQTLELLRTVRYDGAYMFKYSPRENTKAWKMGDDVPDHVKSQRLDEIIQLQNRISWEINQTEIGRTVEVLVEGPSKRDSTQWQGRTDTNKVVVFPHIGATAGYIVGDVVKVRIERATSATLLGCIAE